MFKLKRTALAILHRTPKPPRLRGFVMSAIALSVSRHTARVLAVFFLLASPLFFLTRASTPAYAATNNTLNFQARLQSGAGAIAPDGYYNVEFKLYDASTGGTLLWTETRDYNGGAPDNRVRVANGYLSVNLGDITAFPSTMPWDQQLYLTMNIGGKTTVPSWDGEMSPRLKLTAVPYAFNAKTASQLVTSSGANLASLAIDAPTSGNQTFHIQDQGAAGSYNLLTQTQADASYIQAQSGTPGTAQNTNFNIGTGTGIAATLQATSGISTVDLTATGQSILGSATDQTQLIVKANASQTGNIVEFQNSSGVALSSIDANGQLTLGRVATSGTTQQGSITFADGTTDGFSATITTPTFTADRKFVLPDTALATTASPGTICVFNGAASNCPAATGSAYYIQNTTGSATPQTSANFNIQATDSGTAGTIAGILRGAAGGQTVDLMQLQATNGTVLASFDANGNLLVGGSIDRTTAGTLSIGETNASTISIGTNAAAHTITIGTDATTAQTVTIGSTNSGSATTINGGSGITLGDSTTLAAGKTITITGGNTASRPTPTTEGMLYYDTSTHQLLTSIYNADTTSYQWKAAGSDVVLVAASNSSAADKAAADYVATGTNDQTIINYALTAADPASGSRKTGKVYLFAGTYTTTDKLSIPNNVTLAGAGRGTLIQFGNIAGLTKNMIENSDQTTGTGVVIRDLQLDGNSSVNTTGTMNGIYMNAMGASAGSSARQGATITDVWVNNFHDNGIYENSSANGTIAKTTVQGNGADGLYLSSANRMNVTGNIVQGNAGTGIDLAGSLYDVVASNNIISNGTAASSYGLYLHGSSQYNTINGNNFRDNAGSGTNSTINIYSASNNSITDNTITDTAGTGYAIAITDAASTANYLSNNYHTGAGAVGLADSGTGTLYGGQADGSGNYVIQPAGAIYLNASTNVTGSLTASTAVYAPTFDVATSGGTLDIGGANASAVNIATNAAAHTINIGTDATTAQTIAIGSTNGASALTLKSGTGGTNFDSYGGYTFKSSGTSTLTVGTSGDVNIHPSSDSASAFSVTGSGGTVLQVDNTSGGNVQGSYFTSVLGMKSPNLTIDTAGSAATYTTLGSANLSTRINLGNNTLSGAGSTLIAGGIQSTSDATARGIAIVDYRTVSHQPTIGIITPDESQIGGLTYNGSNTTLTLSNTSTGINFEANGIASASIQQTTSTASIFRVGVQSSSTGSIELANAASGSLVTIASAAQTNSYTLTIPDMTAGNDEFCLKTLANCGAAGATNLQGAYDGGNTITLASNNSVHIYDNATPSTGNLFEITDNAGTTNYFSVSSSATNIGTNTTVAAGKTFTLGTTSGFDATGQLGVGTTAPSRQLQVAVNDTNVNSLPVLIQQNGAGDSGIEIQGPTGSFYTGIDNTDGSYKISSNLASGAAVTMGDTSIEATGDSNANGAQAAKITASATGTAVSVAVYIAALDGTNNLIQVGLYGDNGSGTSPNTLLGSSTAQTAVVGWNTISIPNVSVTSGTVYWIAMAENGNTTFRTALSGGTTAYRLTGGYPLPSTFAADSGNTAYLPSFYLNVNTSADQFATSLFRLSDTGAAIFQNSTNSTAAFRVQNASGTGILTVDTTGTGIVTVPTLYASTIDTASAGTLSVGETNATTISIGANAAAHTINIGTDATTAQTIALGSTNAASATTINGGNGISLTGDTTVATGKNLTVSSGSTSLTGPSAGSSGTLTVNTGATTNTGIVINGVASQSADLLQVNGNGVATPYLNVAAGGKVGIGVTTPGYQLDVAGNINSSTGYYINGTAGASSLTCAANSVLQGTAVTGGIVTGGICHGNTLQSVYDNSGDQPAKVQEVDYNTSTAADTAVSVSPTNQGDLLVAIVGVNAGASQSVSSITDDGGNTWVLAGAGYQTGANNRVEIWYAKNAAQDNTVTVHLSAAVASAIKILEYSNMDTSSPLDIASAQGNASSTTAGTATIATTNSTDLVIGVMSYSSDTTTSTAPASPWQAYIDNSNVSPSPDKQVRSVSQLVSSTGSYSAAWTLSAAESSGAVIAAFKTTGGTSTNADITLADSKDFRIIAPDTTTDPNVIINLQCTTSCGGNGRFAIQNAGTDVFTVSPNSGGVLVKMNASNAFQVQNTTGSSVFSVDTTNKTISIPGDTYANISGIASPTEGMITYDTTNKQLLVYANGKWQADKTPAILVAASNSSQADKNAADYIATGSNDQTVINTALTAASSTGTRKTGMVYLFGGTYTIGTTAGSVNIPSGVTLAGSGASTVLTFANGSNFSTGLIQNSDQTGGNDHIAVQDLKLDGNKANQASGTSMGIYFKNVGTGSTIGAHISNVWVENFKDSGIMFEASSRSTLNGVSAHGNDNNGLTINSSSYITVTGGEFSDNTTNASPGVLISNGSTYNTVSGNVIANNAGVGVNITGSTTTGNTVTGNDIYNNTSNGINIQNATENTVSNNTVKSSGANGIRLSTAVNNLITGNTVSDSTSDAVALVSNSTNNLISNNKLTDSAGTNYAFNIAAGSNYNTLSGNLIGTGATYGVWGNSTGISDAGTGNIYQNQIDASGNQLNATNGISGFFQSNSTTNTNPTLVAQAQGSGNTADLIQGRNYAGTPVFQVGYGGQITLYGGQSPDITTSSTTTARGITIQPGASTGASSNGANVVVKAGNGTGATSVTGGTLTLQGGNATQTTGTQIGGNVEINAGTGNSLSGNILIGTTTANAITIGKTGVTTTIAGNTKVTLSGATGTTMVCQNGSSYLSSCDATYLAPTATNFIQNQNSAAQTTANYWISGTGRADTSILTPSLDRASAGTLSIGTNATNTTAISVGSAATATTIQGQLIANTVLTMTNSFTTSSSYRINLGGTMTSSVTTSQYGIQNQMNFNPNGGSLSNLYGFINLPAISGSNYNITNAYAAYNRIDTTSGFTGQIGSAYGLRIDAPSLGGTPSGGDTRKVLNYYGAMINGTSNGGNTNGTVTNYGLNIQGNTATAGAGGTVNNYSAYIQLGTGGSTGTTSNYGLYLTGNGGTATTNWMIYNTSTAPNYIQGNTSIGTTANPNGYALNVSGTVGVSTEVITPQIDSSTSSLTIGGTATTINLGGGTTAETIQVAQSGAGANGNNLTVKGGAGGSGNTNGGNLTLSGGAGSGTGVMGLVGLNPTFFNSSGSVQTYSTGGINNMSQSLVDNYSTVMATASTSGVILSIPDPTLSTSSYAGRVLYVAAASGSQDFTLRLNATRTNIDINLKANNTATLIWNGTDWTAAGASSATDLQAAYNNTQTSAGGAELVLNAPGGAADGLTIRNNGTPITGALFEVQSSIATDLFSVNNNTTEYAVNGGAENSTFTGWSALGATVTQNTNTSYVATGRNSVSVVTTGNNQGAKDTLSTTLAASSTYVVSFAARVATGGPNTLNAYYSVDGTTNSVACGSSLPGSGYTSTPNFSITTSWTKVSCFITTPSTGLTASNAIQIYETDLGAGTFYIDNLSVISNASSTTPANVQIGGGAYGGQPTIFTLDQFAGPPMGSGNAAYLGSMYYDTTKGTIQCYQSSGWGACGSAPDDIVSLTPEYTGAVLNGTGVGTMTADFCSNSAALTVGTLCASGEARNFYRWTSPQPTLQTYSIYVTYRLPSTFKSFVNGTMSLTGLVDDTTNAGVSYSVYRKAASGGVAQCSADKTVVGWDGTTANGTANTWTAGAPTTDLSSTSGSCGPGQTYAFAGGDTMIIKINVSALSNANAYVENLTFQYSNK